MITMDIVDWQTSITGSIDNLVQNNATTWDHSDFDFAVERSGWVHKSDEETVDAVLVILHTHDSQILKLPTSNGNGTLVEWLINSVLKYMIRDFAQMARLFEYICTDVVKYDIQTAGELVAEHIETMRNGVKYYEDMLLNQFPTLNKQMLFSVLSYQIPWGWTTKFEDIYRKSGLLRL